MVSDIHGGGLTAAQSKLDEAHDLARIDKPVLVIQGDRDRWVPAWPARIALTVRTGWDGSIVPECGHIPPLEKPDEVARHIADWYLQRIASQQPTPGVA
jgi:pimeloyl-ACP methyl ester carboxylesterase